MTLVRCCSSTADAAVSTAVEPATGPAWKRHVIDNTSTGADGVKLGDLNRDRLLDVVTGWEEGGEVRVYLNPGPSKSRAAWPRVTVGRTRSVEEAIFADLDGDGGLDVISGTEGKTRTVYWHRFSGAPDELLKSERWTTTAFPATTHAQQWMQAAALQLDGQHGIDLLLASKGTNAAIGWLQAPTAPGQLADWRYHRLRDAGWIMSLTPSDLDGDGDADAFFTDRRGPRSGIAWLENPGPAANTAQAPWKEHAMGALGREVMFADLGDLDADGRLDVAAAVQPADIVLLLQKPDGVWHQQMLSLVRGSIGQAKAVKMADLNGDSRLDLIVTCEGARQALEGVVWLEQRAGQPWRQHSLGGPDGTKFDLIQALDIDADGDLDVMTCEETDNLGVIWYENPRRTQE